MPPLALLQDHVAPVQLSGPGRRRSSGPRLIISAVSKVLLYVVRQGWFCSFFLSASHVVVVVVAREHNFFIIIIIIIIILYSPSLTHVPDLVLYFRYPRPG